MSNDKPIFIRQEILQQTINDLEEKKAELLELQGKVSYMENYLIIFHNMSVGNSLVLEDIANLKIDTSGIKAAIEVVKADVIAVEAEIVTLTAGQGVLQTDVSNLTTSLTSVNAQVQLLNSGDMTILGQKTFDGTTIFNGEVDMTSTNNTTIGNVGGGITRIDGNATIGTLNSPTDLSGNVTINTGFTNNNTTIGNVSGAGQLFVASTTNLNGTVNATSTNNKIIGNTGGGITQIKGTTQINSADIGNTDIGNAGGGTTKLSGVLQLSDGAAFSPVNIPSLIGLGDINNIGGSFVRTGAGVAGYIANTSVYGLNGITLPYGRYAFTLRILISNNSATTAFLNIFPVFTTTPQVEGATIGSVANQVLFGGQENGYRDLVFLNQTQVFNTSGLTYIDTNNFDFPIMGVNVFISVNCNFQFSLAVHRIA
jgi:hypothetical protein